MAVSVENYNNISADNGHAKTEQWSVQIITTTSVLTLQKIKLKYSQFGELNNTSSDTEQDKTERQSVWSDNQHGKLQHFQI